MKLATIIAGYLIILFTLIPLVRSDNWIFRIFEYPRFQKLILALVILVLTVGQFDTTSTHGWILVGLLCANVAYLCYLIFPYTRVAANQVKRFKSQRSEPVLSMLICNVYQDNRNVKALLRQIEQLQPDIVLVVEVDSFWTHSLEVLHERYHHRVLNPLENTYGMSLYSKFELIDPEIRFLVKAEVPSIRTVVKLLSGQLVKVYALHPEPPVPSENPRSTERDAEILTVAKEAKHERMPVIVAGDLNDVAWSFTTESFMKVSGLLDPRRGRGFFNTFHAKYRMLRWPLDHVFCSSHFELVALQRLPYMGSDHFPMFISVALTEAGTTDQVASKARFSAKDQKVAQKKTVRAN